MDNYKSISKWRSFLKEEKSTPIDSPEYRKHTGKKEPKIKVPLALDKQKPDKSFYADVIKQAEKTAGIEPPEEKKT